MEEEEILQDLPQVPEPKPEDPRALFYTSFTSEIKALEETITNLSSARVADRQPSIDHILSKIGELTHDLKDASNYLPGYDQRVYSEQLKTLADQLSTSRKAFAPRTKFSFKNRSSNSRSSAAASEATIPGVTAPAETVSVEALPAVGNSSSGFETPPAGTPQTTTKQDQNPTSVSTLSSHQNAHLTTPLATPTTTILSLTTLHRCIITHPLPVGQTPTAFTTLAVNDATSSILIPNPVAGPAHLTSLTNCIVVLTCHQFRLHSSHNVDVYLSCGSRPIIEHCKNIRVSSLPKQFANSEGSDNEMWKHIDDFNWLKEGRPSPNWRVLEEGEKVSDGVWEKVLEEGSKLDEELVKVLPGEVV
ncbi:hypothetical protein ABW20_dc0102973 [Dactylellina cionopaga]|nr:hypothetical protein ABW20_dc0102973 [Dactylellina cionopaga]